MEQVVVKGRLYIGGSASGDLVNVHASQVDAEPLVVPQALIIQAIEAQAQSQKYSNKQERS